MSCGGPTPPRQKVGGSKLAQRQSSKGSLLPFVTPTMLKTGLVWIFFSKGGLWRTKIFIFFSIWGLFSNAHRKQVKNSLSWRVKSTHRDTQGKKKKKQAQGRKAKINDDSFSWAVGSSCKQTHHNKHFLICFCPTANRFCGFCRIEYTLSAEASVSELVTANYGSLIPEDKKKLLATNPSNCCSCKVKQQSFWSVRHY